MSEPAPNQFALLKTRRFLPLFLVQFLGAFNDQTYQKAFLALITYRLADEIGMPTGILLPISSILFILPFAIIAPSAGQLADRRDKAVLMRYIKAWEIVLMLIACVGYYTQNIFLLYALVFLMGAQSAMFAPIKYSVLPQYLRREELMIGNGLVQGFTFLAIIFGTIVGNELILRDGGTLVICIIVVVVAVIGFVASLYAPSAPPIKHVGKVDWNLARAILTLFRECRTNRPAMRAIYAISWFWFLGATFLTLLYPYGEEELGVDEGVLTILLAGFSVGVALGAIGSGLLSRGKIDVSLPPIGAFGLAIMAVELWIATPVAPGPDTPLLNRSEFFSTFTGWRVFIDFVLIAAFAGLYVTPMNVVLQTEAPDNQRASFIALSNVVDSAAIVLNGLLVLILVAAGVKSSDILIVVTLTALPMSFLVARYAPETLYGRIALSVWPR